MGREGRVATRITALATAVFLHEPLKREQSANQLVWQRETSTVVSQAQLRALEGTYAGTCSGNW